MTNAVLSDAYQCCSIRSHPNIVRVLPLTVDCRLTCYAIELCYVPCCTLISPDVTWNAMLFHAVSCRIVSHRVIPCYVIGVLVPCSMLRRCTLICPFTLPCHAFGLLLTPPFPFTLKYFMLCSYLLQLITFYHLHANTENLCLSTLPLDTQT